MTTSEAKFKYQDFLNDFDECDLGSFISQEKDGYRWVYAPISDVRNFIPLYAKPGYSGSKTECIGYALSMFANKNDAVERFKELISGKPNSYKKIGTHLSTGKITVSDGKSNSSNSKGHFSFFEFENVDLSTTFEVIEKLIND